MKIVVVLVFCLNVLPALCLENSSCDPSECLMWCSDGFKVDSSGCYICECADSANVVISDLESIACPDAMCLMDCPHGMTKDANGCPLCECEELQSVHVAVNFVHDEIDYIELEAFKRSAHDLFLRLLNARKDFVRDIEVEKSDGTSIEVHFRLMGQSSEALATALGAMTSRVRQGDGEVTVTYANTAFVANSVTSLDDDPDSPSGFWLMVETWQQVALVALAAAVVVAIVVVIVVLVMKRKHKRQSNDKKKSRSNACYKKAPMNPAPANKIYLDHVYSA